MPVSPYQLHQSPFPEVIRGTLYALPITSQVQGNAYYIYFHTLEFSECISYDTNSFHHLLLSNHQRRREADDMIVGRLSYQAIFLQRQTDIPSRLPILGFRHDSVQQAFTPYFLNHRIIDLLNLATEQFTHLESVLRETLVAYHLQGAIRYLRRQWIAPRKVKPCSPGAIVSMISSSANTAETGLTPPDKAFPKIKISGRIPS